MLAALHKLLSSHSLQVAGLDVSDLVVEHSAPTRNKDNMAVLKIAVIFAVISAVAYAQRPFYAGFRPIGYPQTQPNALFNRFGEDEYAPIEAKGDVNLINRLNQMPVNNRPFWYINWRQYDALRRNPQVYPQRPNVFLNNI
ncbi:jg2617 [Pararge aegeria aegeria]|uniref:Jg2617 protein n=1 Tax=Pararge aegeria aegeria TaxID=348720 RepID=A0A8S4R380_9NEOP|nr:jg2617 [Pararge aegeria aegeria]